MAAAAVSCRIDPYGYENHNDRTGNTLIRYSEGILDKFGVAQTRNLIYLLTLDEFLKLSPEEQDKKQWENFKSNLEHYSDTYFRIKSRGIKLDTRGLSLIEPGTSWIMEVIDDYNFTGNTGHRRDWVGNFGSIPGHSNIFRITCTAENQYEIIDEVGGKEIMVLSLEAIPSPYGGFDFTGGGSGKILANKRGLSATYSLPEIYYRKYRVDEDGTGNSSVTVEYKAESLNLKVYTYHNNEPLDWCELIKTADEEMEYRTNLEIVEEDYYWE